jgi:hypothetical protein
MTPSILRIILAGIDGGFAMNIVMLLTFRLIGFGWNGKGILLNPDVQSEKLIAVWTEIEPIPLVINNPAPIIIGIILFGIIHAFVYCWVSPAWPDGIVSRAMRMSILIFILVFSFWEFFTPFNMFGEPLPLIGLELLFWAIIALADGFVIAFIIEKETQSKQ